MKIPKLQIGNVTADIPIVQGGMGVQGLPFLTGFRRGQRRGNRHAVKHRPGRFCRLVKANMKGYPVKRSIREIHKVKKMTAGPVAVNFMGALSNVNDLIVTAVAEGIKIIVFGAGLPTTLPELVPDPAVNLVPIVSSARVAELILRVWDKRYGRTADAFILEGPLAGGHLGFSREQLGTAAGILPGSPFARTVGSGEGYEDKYGRKIPVIAGGGIFDGRDIARMLRLGASGVQMATRFVCTVECDVSAEFKQAYLDAKEEDIVIIDSPVGMPGRAIRNHFIKGSGSPGRLTVQCPYRCLTACKADKANYCIAKVLLNSYLGDVKNGLIFCGQNAYRIKKIVTVKELLADLVAELKSL